MQHGPGRIRGVHVHEAGGVTMASKNQAIIAIQKYMGQVGGAYSNWYVGIASDARHRLFRDHNVRESGDRWRLKQCPSSAVAREVEVHFVNTLGTDGGTGGTGGGDAAPDKVYAYLKTSLTNP